MIVSSEWYCSKRTPPGATRATRCARAVGLIRVVHHAERVDDQIGRPTVGHRCETPVGQQAQPGATVGTAELGYPPSAGEPSRCCEAFNGVDGLCDQRRGLGAERLFGHGGFADQLRQAAR